jgi:hypothetical protein
VLINAWVKTGVAGRILHVTPYGIVWHCMNHHLELVVGDTIEEESRTSISAIIHNASPSNAICTYNQALTYDN